MKNTHGPGPGRAPPTRHVKGFTLVEVAVVLAVIVVLASVVMPTAFDAASKGRRFDGVSALNRLQVAQEQYHSQHGRYANAGSRVLPPRSEMGYYDLALLHAGADGYEAVAHARSDGPQRRDRPCVRITLSVKEGFAKQGPNSQCWQQ